MLQERERESESESESERQRQRERERERERRHKETPKESLEAERCKVPGVLGSDLDWVGAFIGKYAQPVAEVGPRDLQISSYTGTCRGPRPSKEISKTQNCTQLLGYWGILKFETTCELRNEENKVRCSEACTISIR